MLQRYFEKLVQELDQDYIDVMRAKEATAREQGLEAIRTVLRLLGFQLVEVALEDVPVAGRHRIVDEREELGMSAGRIVEALSMGYCQPDGTVVRPAEIIVSA
jgi:molecular chaperone GrpE (heat shock protein)